MMRSLVSDQKNKSSQQKNKTTINQIQASLHGHHIKFKIGTEINVQKVLEDYHTTFNFEKLLFQFLANEQAFYIKAQQLRDPLIFYYGHTMAMYIDKLIQKGCIQQRVNEKLQAIFADRIQQSDCNDLNQRNFNWLTIKQVENYRENANKIILNAISKLQDRKIYLQGPVWDILLCIQHHKIHLQTTSYYIRRMPLTLKKSVQCLKECPFRQINPQNIPQNELIEVPNYSFNWKFNKDNASMYLFDNEMGTANSQINSFQISKYQVSNGQFFNFMKDGGYNKLQFWTQQGKVWLKSKKRKYPVFWQFNQPLTQQNLNNPKKYKLRTLSGITDMPWDWPVEVNHLQARAFCDWKSKVQNKQYQLPSEEQYYATRDNNIDHFDQRDYIDGNINRYHWYSPCPVNFFQNGSVYNIIGNVWQHTRTFFSPFSGFKVQSNFDNYSEPYFGQKYSILLGGCFASGVKQALVTRNFYRHHFYNFGGFRYTLSTNQLKKYATKEQSRLFQLNQRRMENIIENYLNQNSYLEKSLNLLKENIFFTHNNQQKISFIIGVSVGRLAFQFGKIFQKVLAIDYQQKQFKIATKILQNKQLYIGNGKSITLQSIGVTNTNNIQFIPKNPENSFSNKLNNVNVILLDGKALRKGRLWHVIKNTIKSELEEKQKKKIKLIVISCKNNKNEINQEIVNELQKENIQMIYQQPLLGWQEDFKLNVFQF